MKRLLYLLSFLFLVKSLSATNPTDRLLERIMPGASQHIITELTEATPYDFFELDSDNGKVVIRGNTWVNIATGINWYLKYHTGTHLTWNCMQAPLLAEFPLPSKERHETNLTLRYNFNYCTFSYSMAFWDWERWQREIDWMAMHGVNMPLAAVGQECVWRNVLLRLGYTDKEVGNFIAGPAFLAWWAMNNLEGWGGPLTDSWYTRQEELQKNILNRMRELGMEAVLPGYCGMMPHDAREHLGLEVTDGGKWNGYRRPANLSATDPRFDEIADLYYSELTKLYGTSHYYSTDPFHESHDDAAVDYAAAGKALMNAIKRTNPEARWVIQGWTENPRPTMMEAIEPGELIILDLFSECRPMWGAESVWRRNEGYGPHHWLFCMLENFGANVGLHGRMDQLLDNFYSTRTHPLAANIKGIGFTMEGAENNPVMFELMSELPWRSERVTRPEWLTEYVKARYGFDDPAVQEAWQLLGATIYNCPPGNNQQGPHESIFCGRPSLDNFQVKSWSKMRNYYDPAATLQAAVLMNSVADRYRGNNNFEYDLVDITRQAMADQARRQYLHTIADYRAFAREDFERGARRFLDMLDLQDRLLGTRSEFRLGHWIEPARAAGTTEIESDLYEWNARTQITTWGNRECADRGGLRDYANKEWQGLLSDFYRVRWAHYFKALSDQMEAHSQPDYEALGSGPNASLTSAELFKMALPAGPVVDWYSIEEPWTLLTGGYTSAPEGNPVDVAHEVITFLTAEK